MIQLYDHPLSCNAHKVRNMLSLLDVDYERVAVDLSRADPSHSTFGELNLFRPVPMLVDAGVVIRDAGASLVYLGRKYGRGRWLPVDAVGEARVAEWLATATADVAEGPGRARRIERFGLPGDLEAARGRAHRVFEAFDRHLDTHPYLAGRMATIADIANYPALALAPDGGVEIDDYRNVLRWFQRLQTLPGFEAVPSSEPAQDPLPPSA